MGRLDKAIREMREIWDVQEKLGVNLKVRWEDLQPQWTVCAKALRKKGTVHTWPCKGARDQNVQAMQGTMDSSNEKLKGPKQRQHWNRFTFLVITLAVSQASQWLSEAIFARAQFKKLLWILKNKFVCFFFFFLSGVWHTTPAVN